MIRECEGLIWSVEGLYGSVERRVENYSLVGEGRGGQGGFPICCNIKLGGYGLYCTALVYTSSHYNALLY